MGIGRDTDAAIAALGAQLIAFAAARRVVEALHCLRQAALIVAAVVNHGGAIIGLVGKISALDEIPSAHLHLIDVEVACDGIDRAFGDVSSLGPAVAAIGVDRHGVGH